MVATDARPPLASQLTRAGTSTRRRKLPPNASANAALLASARRLKTTEPDDLKWLQKQRQGWQTQAWMFNDTVPEVNFAHRYLQNVLSRLRIFPAWRPDPNAQPIPLDPDEPPDDVPKG